MIDPIFKALRYNGKSVFSPPVATDTPNDPLSFTEKTEALAHNSNELEAYRILEMRLNA